MPKDLAAKILEARGRIEGERRQVTVLFCDLARSTEIGERLDAETDRELINEYLEGPIRSVYRYEGVITGLAGDGFMAIFGAQVAHDDDPARACRAALEITAGLKAVGRKWEEHVGHPIAARIGLNSGPVVVGTVGNDTGKRGVPPRAIQISSENSRNSGNARVTVDHPELFNRRIRSARAQIVQ